MTLPWPVVIVGVASTLQTAMVVELATAVVGLATALIGLYRAFRRLTRTESQ